MHEQAELNFNAKCLRCGYVWKPRLTPVRFCAWCKSKLWNKPRRYFSPESADEPTEKRFLPTGRKAAKLAKLEAERREFESEVLRRCVNCNATNLNAEIVFIENLSVNLCRKCKTEFQM